MWHLNSCKDLALDAGVGCGWGGLSVASSRSICLLRAAAAAVDAVLSVVREEPISWLCSHSLTRHPLHSSTSPFPSSLSLSLPLRWQTQIQQRNIFHFSLVSFAFPSSIFSVFRFLCHLAFYFDKLLANLAPSFSPLPLPPALCTLSTLNYYPKNGNDIPHGSLILFISFGMYLRCEFTLNNH